MNKVKKLLLRWFQLVSMFLLIGVFLIVGKTAIAESSQVVNGVFGNPNIDIDQTTLESSNDENGYSLRRVLEAGAYFFSQPYTPVDGVGEGSDGPRSGQRRTYYPNANINFLKFNGLGAQSCFECHHSIGTYLEPGTQTNLALVRKPAATGGSSGFASNAYINPDFPSPITELIRNPPHVFGTGYTQELGDEMTMELQTLMDTAHNNAKKTANKQVKQALTAKSLSFGTFKTTYSSTGYNSTTCPSPNTIANDTNGNPNYCDDTSEVTGVPSDLVIRPFQWKGISSSVRHFARDAMDFHFSMQAVEKVGSQDCDKDGVINEVTIGNLSALTAFVAMTRPPIQNPSTLNSTQQQGQQLFEQNCATCHTQELPVYMPRVLIATPPSMPSDGGTCPTEAVTLSNSYSENGENLEVIKQYKAVKDKLLSLVSATSVAPGSSNETYNFEKAFKAVMEEEGSNNQVAYGSSQGYSISLNPSQSDDLPAYVYGNDGNGRLPVDPSTGNISVPLYSDLRTHNMGQGLSDIVPQGSDVADISISNELFLTRPLWGVADTGPWLHDGRARSLEEAILMHADLSNPDDGSEAAGAVQAFMNLSGNDKDALVNFLLTLQLPVQYNLQIENTSSSAASGSPSS